jgi:hypothetical protein
MSSPKQPSSGPATGSGTTARRLPVQLAALVFGAVFLLVGILGFIPGITTNYDQLTFAGPMSGALLLGLFAVSILHNLVHLAFGIAGIALSRSWNGSKQYLLGGGAVYLLLWLVGMFSAMDWLPADVTDHWLHFALGLGMVALGFALSRRLGIDDRDDRRVRAPA